MSLFPYDLTKLLAGPIRLLFAPIATAIPTNIEDVIEMVDPYDVKAGWVDLGATTDETEYNFDLEASGYTIQQDTAEVARKITRTGRSITVPLAEHTDAFTKLAEEGQGPTTIAAGPNKGAQKAVDVGTIESLTRYRFAAIAMRDTGFGALVTEPGGDVRGPFVAFAGYQTSIAAEEQSVGFDREDLSARELTLEFFPDGTIADKKTAVGRWLFEEPGAIAAV